MNDEEFYQNLERLEAELLKHVTFKPEGFEAAPGPLTYNRDDLSFGWDTTTNK